MLVLSSMSLGFYSPSEKTAVSHSNLSFIDSLGFIYLWSLIARRNLRSFCWLTWSLFKLILSAGFVRSVWERQSGVHSKLKPDKPDCRLKITSMTYRNNPVSWFSHEVGITCSSHVSTGCFWVSAVADKSLDRDAIHPIIHYLYYLSLKVMGRSWSHS